MKRLIPSVAAVFALLGSRTAMAVERFPPPDLGPEYSFPYAQNPLPRAGWLELLDAGVLLAALALATLLVYRWRSRRGVLLLGLFAIAYFGFYREGCICPIGAIQNVSLALADSSYVLPLAAALFFVLPLATALLYGRTYCAAACPHGAVQDAVIVRPVTVPPWLEQGLRMFRHVYLVLAVIFAATGAAFVICRYDPFIAIFRLDGPLYMLLLAGSFLLLGTVVARPYCRYLCPYGAILSVLSRFSAREVTITPDRCTNCELCEDACPVSAILPPTHDLGERERVEGRGRLVALIVALPLLVGGSALLGYQLGPPLARMHPTVELADRLAIEEAGLASDTTDASDAFRRTTKTVAELDVESAVLVDDFRLGALLGAAWLALVFWSKLLSLVIRRKRPEYSVERGHCLACARCYPHCPEGG